MNQKVNNLWIPSYQNDTEARLNLFCFPYAGGTTYIYQQWSQLLPPTIAVYPIELPGRRKRFQEPPYTNLEALLADLAVAIKPFLNKPFIFFGHSMGGLIAFELTRWLRRQYDIFPQHLIISACRATQLPRSKPPIHNLPDAEFRKEIIRLGGTPQVVLDNSEMMELILPTLRADFTKIETHIYKEKTPLNTPISVFGGNSDSEVTQEELAAWEEQTTKEFSLTMFEGDHFFLEEQRSLVLKRITKELEKYL